MANSAWASDRGHALEAAPALSSCPVGQVVLQQFAWRVPRRLVGPHSTPRPDRRSRQSDLRASGNGRAQPGDIVPPVDRPLIGGKSQTPTRAKRQAANRSGGATRPSGAQVAHPQLAPTLNSAIFGADGVGVLVGAVPDVGPVRLRDLSVRRRPAPLDPRKVLLGRVALKDDSCQTDRTARSAGHWRRQSGVAGCRHWRSRTVLNVHRSSTTTKPRGPRGSWSAATRPL